MTVRDWRRGHRWWLLLAFAGRAGQFVRRARGGRHAAGRVPVPGCGSRPPGSGGCERADDALLWVRVDWLGRALRPPRPASRSRRTAVTGIAAGDAAPGGSRRRAAALV